MQRLLTKKEVAELLGVSQRTVDRYRQQGLEIVGGVGNPRFALRDVEWFLRKANKISKSRGRSVSASPGKNQF